MYLSPLCGLLTRAVKSSTTLWIESLQARRFALGTQILIH